MNGSDEHGRFTRRETAVPPLPIGAPLLSSDASGSQGAVVFVSLVPLTGIARSRIGRTRYELDPITTELAADREKPACRRSHGQIAEAAGIGIRSLQEGFRRFKGTSPTSDLTQLRMEAVHRELMEGELEVSISEIARKWGFRHMGRFSSDYRKSYGRPPSQARKGRSKP